MLNPVSALPSAVLTVASVDRVRYAHKGSDACVKLTTGTFFKTHQLASFSIKTSQGTRTSSIQEK